MNRVELLGHVVSAVSLRKVAEAQRFLRFS